MDILEKVNEVHLDNLGVSDATSIYIKNNEYRILTLRFLEFVNENLDYSSLSYVVFQDEIYLIDNNKNVEKLSEKSIQLYKDTHNRVQYLSHLISIYVNGVETLEDQIFERKRLNSFLSEWFHYRKGLLKLNRVFERVSTVMSEFIKNEQELIKESSKEFSDLQYDIEVQQRIIKSELEKLDTIYTYYTSLKNDNLNRNILVLSIISGIFLPLNLIVGFFGMNTSGLFLANHANGTSVVFNLILILFSVLLVGPPVFSLLNRIIISKLFGRYKFYSKLSSKFEKLTSDFNILEDK